MSLTVLSVGYPLAAAGPDAAGGAEQVLSTLDRGLVEAGWRSVVVAPVSSQVAGRLEPIPDPPARLDDAARLAAQAATRGAVARALERHRPDVIHLHGIDFGAYLPSSGPPCLATLHLPLSWYEPAALAPARPDVVLVPVSASQLHEGPPVPGLLPPIPNGVDLDAFGGPHARRSFALLLGRICPEKGVHLAIEAARRADAPLLIAGEVYGYEAHRRYFDEEIAPRLDRRRRFIGPVGGARKRRLLAGARCVLIPSLAPETSSLVAREAAASGAPVVAFPSGALAEAVEHGRTGFLVADAAEMAEAMAAADGLDRAAIRAVARARFGKNGMVAAYLDLYARLAAGRAAA